MSPRIFSGLSALCVQMRDLKYECPQHSTMTFDASVMTVGPFLFLEIPKRVSSFLIHTYILLYDCSRCTSFANNQTLKSRLVSVGIKDPGLEVGRSREVTLPALFRTIIQCTMPPSPHFINNKINTWSIYFSYLFGKMKWVNKCESVLSWKC